MRGVLVAWEHDKGYGFIQVAECSENLFVSSSAFGKIKHPHQGDKVIFDAEATAYGKPKVMTIRHLIKAPPPTQTTKIINKKLVIKIIFLFVGAGGLIYYSQSNPDSIPSKDETTMPTIPYHEVIAQAPRHYSPHTFQTYPPPEELSKFYSEEKITPPPLKTPPKAKEKTNPSRCDGRTHCSQMSSCQEATYFLKNCPNTTMDGDNDGVPCEQQWCNW